MGRLSVFIMLVFFFLFLHTMKQVWRVRVMEVADMGIKVDSDVRVKRHDAHTHRNSLNWRYGAAIQRRA